MRKWFYGLNFALLGVFIWAYLLDFSPEWKGYQKKYYKMAAEAYEKQAQGEKSEEKAKVLRAEAKKLRRAPMEIKQIISRDLAGRVDRCITCHVGMDEYTNPTLVNDFTEQPFKAHPDLGMVRKHPFQKFGCTICHEGQGLATTVKDGHGHVHNWEDPLLEGKRIQGACLRCHGDHETLKGAEFATLGKTLFNKHGCQGCHSIKGAGGIISVDLGNIADKPLERIAGYNFSRVMKDGKPLDRHDWTLQNWVWGHLSNDPIEVTPNDPFAKFNKEPIAPSGMPDFREELGPEGAEAITAYLMSMTDEQVPANYHVHGPKPVEPSFADPIKNGKRVFEKYGCAGCHGLEGKKGRRNYNALGPGQEDPAKDMDKGREPTLNDVVGTYTHEELKHKIQEGVKSSAVVKFNPNGPQPFLYMPPWKEKIKGKELDDLATWLLSTAKKDDSGF
jgi:mono/diheme cytochrome c family protein